MQEYGILTTLTFGKYSSQIFAQRKANGKLRLLVDLCQINQLMKYEYGEHNHRVTTISHEAQHMAQKFFCKLDCSQAYLCIQTANEHAVQLLSFNFGSPTFAYQRLAQGFNTSFPAFKSVIGKYLDPTKTNRCAVCRRHWFSCPHRIRIDQKPLPCAKTNPKAGLNLSIKSCQFGGHSIDVLREDHFRTRNCTNRGTDSELFEIPKNTE